ncbi:hypothetical protein O9K51_10558 [Purpureocillium lavendulum]|uniref:Uncharacterized protein n=1 Tax=Purpureocillium lavendulum TaxID=1247861 RepID=A0AB34FDQ3_9HYPO|nr:hypothetical protein O9K51_10558 [Purpureocillium lavendulum]
MNAYQHICKRQSSKVDEFKLHMRISFFEVLHVDVLIQKFSDIEATDICDYDKGTTSGRRDDAVPSKSASSGRFNKGRANSKSTQVPCHKPPYVDEGVILMLIVYGNLRRSPGTLA